MFSKTHMTDTKKLLEGGGKSVHVKFSNPFPGFVNAFTVITANTLPPPFVKPTSSGQFLDEEEWLLDKNALEARCTLHELKTSFERDVGVFPFTCLDWAMTMVKMYNEWDDFPKYVPPKSMVGDINEVLKVSKDKMDSGAMLKHSLELNVKLRERMAVLKANAANAPALRCQLTQKQVEIDNLKKEKLELEEKLKKKRNWSDAFGIGEIKFFSQ